MCSRWSIYRELMYGIHCILARRFLPNKCVVEAGVLSILFLFVFLLLVVPWLVEEWSSLLLVGGNGRRVLLPCGGMVALHRRLPTGESFVESFTVNYRPHDVLQCGA